MYIFEEYLLNKIWLKNIDFTVTAIMLERGMFRGLFCPPPPFTPRSNRCTYIHNVQ